MNGLVEIARQFTFKLTCGNYQSADFFCSQKAECKRFATTKQRTESGKLLSDVIKTKTLRHELSQNPSDTARRNRRSERAG